MANLSLRLSPGEVFLVVGDGRVRELTEYGTDIRQTRAGKNLIGFSALALYGVDTLGVIQVTTSERDVEALVPGVMLTVSGVVEATFAGTDANYGLRTSLYAEIVEPTAVNGWAVLRETVRRATQVAAK